MNRIDRIEKIILSILFILSKKIRATDNRQVSKQK